MCQNFDRQLEMHFTTVYFSINNEIKGVRVLFFDDKKLYFSMKFQKKIYQFFPRKISVDKFVPAGGLHYKFNPRNFI